LRMHSTLAARYLQEFHGLPLAEKTIRNWRSRGKGPRCKYLGVTAIYERSELDRWASEDALSPVSRAGRPRDGAAGVTHRSAA
jgi:hypothetical protein